MLLICAINNLLKNNNNNNLMKVLKSGNLLTGNCCYIFCNINIVENKYE